MVVDRGPAVPVHSSQMTERLLSGIVLWAFGRVCTQGGPGGEGKETINVAMT